MSKKSIIVVLLIFIGIMVVISLLISRETKPSPDTRIILEHTYKTYIAPRCFEQSNATNFLQDSTLDEAQYLNYEPHDHCTEIELESIEDSLFISILKDIGVLDKKWDDW